MPPFFCTMNSQFAKEMAAANSHAEIEIGDEDAVVFNGGTYPAIVDISTTSNERVYGGKRDKTEVTVFMRESIRVSAGIKKGSRLEIPSRDLTVRVESLGNYTGGQRTLDCVGPNLV